MVSRLGNEGKVDLSPPPLILLCNDDGIHSLGLTALWEAVADLGEVWVVAPSLEQSAQSHAITLVQPLRAHEVRPRWLAVTGTPTDCAYLALNHLLPRAPALTISGINHGPNVGDDVHYSGTVAAAMEAALLGCPASMAISLACGGPWDFTAAKVAARRLAMRVLQDGLDAGVLLNVNVPANVRSDVPLRLCALGKRRYTNEVDARRDPRGRPYYWIGGQELEFEPIAGSDGEALGQGYVAVTPLRLDSTHREALEKLRRWEAPASTSAGAGPDADRGRS